MILGYTHRIFWQKLNIAIQLDDFAKVKSYKSDIAAK